MSTEFVGIELKLMGADGVRRDLEQLDKLLNSFRGRKKFDMGLTEAREQVLAYKGEIEKLRREQDKFAKNSDEWKRYAALIDEARQKLWNAQQAVREFGLASREAGRTFMQTFNAISSKVAHLGSAMQSFGNAMTNLTSPFRRITSGIVMGAGFKAINSFTEGFERGFTRYDTMKKYPKIMAAFGYSAEEAQKSIDALDMSVRGLPTGLDEMVDLAQRFTATTGDIDKGTKLAIAANNAFLASMSTDTQKYQGMMQLQDVLGGKDMNAREWNSLVSSMTPAIVKMGESMGYTNENMSEFIQTIRDGKMDNQEFIDQLIKIGNEGGVLEAMAQESKNTWQAFFANVGNASSRMMAGILKAFDEISQAVAGKDVNQLFADTIIPSIDKTTKSIKKWIRAHPAEITKFFQDLKKIKIGNFLKGYAKGLEIMIGLVEKLGTALGKHPKLMSFLGGFFGMGGTIGKMSTIFGGLLKGTRHIWGGIGASGSWLLKGRFGGIFGRIASIFGDKKSIKAAGDAAKEIPTVANTFRSAFKSLETLLKIGGTIVIAGGTAWFATTAVKGVLNDLKDIGNIISSGDIDWNSAATAMIGFGAYLTAFTSVAYVMGDIGKTLDTTVGLQTLKAEVILGAITALAFGIADLDMFFIKDMFKKFKDITTYLNESIDNLLKLKEIKNISDIKDRISNVIGALQQVYGSLKVQDEEGRSLMAASSQEMKAMQDVVGGMNNVLGSIQGVNDKLLELSQAKLIRKSDAVNVGEQIGGIFEGLGEIFSSYLGTAFGDNPAEMTLGMTSTIENFNKAFETLTGDNGLFANLRKVQNELRSIPGVQTIGSTLSNIKSWLTGEGGMFDQLRDIVTSANKITNADTVETKMSNFANAFESIRVIFKKLNQIKKVTADYQTGDIPGIGVIRRLIGQLQVAFDSEAVNRINSQIQAFLDQVNNLLETVDTINAKDGKITIEITLKDQIIGKDKVIRDINKVQTDIQKAVDNIKSYYPKTITVAINTKAIVSGIGSAANTVASIPQQVLERYKANGGLIYRAGGGSVPWKRRGTDTVPAMLTPGEYVHNKRAVSTFGIDFMRKVNNLDMKGAMNELMHRAGHMANINRGTNITNNNYNNQKVVINNSNAGAGYTFKTASRFVGAF